MATNEQAYAQATAQFQSLVNTLDRFVNGGEDETVQLTGGMTKTIRGIVKEMRALKHVQRVYDMSTRAALMPALALYPEGTLFRIFNDPLPQDNGLYQKEGVELKKINYQELVDLIGSTPP